MKIKHTKEEPIINTPMPERHKEIVCSKCGMGNYYCTVRCWNCKEPFKPEQVKE